jgi:hypothetical protein
LLVGREHHPLFLHAAVPAEHDARGHARGLALQRGALDIEDETHAVGQAVRQLRDDAGDHQIAAFEFGRQRVGQASLRAQTGARKSKQRQADEGHAPMPTPSEHKRQHAQATQHQIRAHGPQRRLLQLQRRAADQRQRARRQPHSGVALCPHEASVGSPDTFSPPS